MSDDTEHGELAVGWLLHTLEPEQERRFLAHVGECEECRRVVGETSPAIESVGRALPQYDLPPGLRDRILAAAAAEELSPGDDDVVGAGGPAAGLRAGPSHGAKASSETLSVPNDALATSGGDGVGPGGAGAGGSGRGDDGVGVGVGGAEGGSVLPLRASRRRWAVRGLAVAAVAAVVALVAGLSSANQSLRDDRDSAVASANEARQVVRMLDSASAPGVRHATLAAPSGALVGLVADDGHGPRVLATGLAGNRPDQTYVLWGMASGGPVGLGAFDLPASGSSVRSVRSGQAAPFTGYAVSLEPGRTVPAAPTEIVASGTVGR